eukprot:7551611-Pyramimonas_sp.AAC.1
MKGDPKISARTSIIPAVQRCHASHVFFTPAPEHAHEDATPEWHLRCGLWRGGVPQYLASCPLINTRVI